MWNTIQSLEHQIESIKRQILAIGDLRRGSLSRQYSVCGKPTCRCAASPPQKHGPYYQLSFWRKGKSSSRFVRPQEVASIRRHVNNHARLRALVDRWVDLATELSELKLRKGT